jgi:GYF domain 2
MSYHEAMGAVDSDLWHVQLASGEVCTMTLDLLDDAFQDGIISEQTFVWQEGSPNWTTLGEVAGLDAVDSEAAVLMSSSSSGYESSPWPSTVISATYPPTSLDPRDLANPYSLTPYSTAPVAGDITDIDFDVDSVTFRPRKRSKLRWLLAAAFIGAIGFGAVKRNELAHRYRVYLPPSVAAKLARVPMFAAALRAEPTPSPVQVAAPTPPPVQVAAPTPPPPVPTPLGAAAQPAPAPAAVDTRFSDDQKKALLDADTTRAAKQKQKQKTRVAAPSSKPRLKSENPFHKGGDQFDPLNASL